ncbi:M50 family metallopeptidase [Paenibacillus alkalitolerans]|uniref:M50 family metallopeptidase n=1 Tax=Paenibacillus alkalitolerans TaxID=2799335 RepID=UPI001F41724C|nr:M50 family metallopeptidase [Paenibacillus alkalitolerans]
MINIWGVRFRIHPLLTIVLLLSAVTGHFIEIITLFGIVVIHELGHITAAKHFGWRMREVRLTPFGGVAVTDEAGSVPAREEAVVAVSGPLMNVLMIGFAYGLEAAGVWTEAWMHYWVRANMTLLLFNLIPVMPLDGGKLLQSLFSLAVPYHRTLRVTVMVSLLASAAMLGTALSRFGSGGIELNLAMIASFLLYSNWYEWKTLPYRFIRFLMRRNARVEDWMRRGVMARPILVKHKDKLPAVVTKLLRERLHIVLVMDERGQLLTVLPEQYCTTHYLEKKKDSAVADLFM